MLKSKDYAKGDNGEQQEKFSYFLINYKEATSEVVERAVATVQMAWLEIADQAARRIRQRRSNNYIFNHLL
ncbi:hypothetical protein BN873_270104 [Candidatus Competibacter denitrificans Run_A_D11]|uniref:Uncharacterized protein n=1 Tax=Candidatus Competibacter denitrificans Run_A_D11 TaxID=1400863 RepID=W6MCY1_9GAMM|nr:hypothetical protein BN873_270104 [Candidatus Competibacter denitrificans Run_A_D11]